MKEMIFWVDDINQSEIRNRLFKLLDEMAGVLVREINLNQSGIRIVYDESVISDKIIIERAQANGFFLEFRGPVESRTVLKEMRNACLLDFIKLIALIIMLVGIGVACKDNWVNEVAKLVIVMLASFVSMDMFNEGIRSITRRRFDYSAVFAIIESVVLIYLMAVAVSSIILGQYGKGALLGNYYSAYIVSMLIYRLYCLTDGIVCRGNYKESRRFIIDEDKECIRYVKGKGEKVARELICVGDILIIRPGERILFDSIIIKGETMINMTMSRGGKTEFKTAGDRVFAGSINEEGALYVKVTATGADSAREANYRQSVDQNYGRYSYYSGAIVNRITVASAFIGLITCLVVGIVRSDLAAYTENGIVVMLLMLPAGALFVKTFTDVIANANLKKNHIHPNEDVEEILEAAAATRNLVIDENGVMTKPEMKCTKVYTKLENDELMSIVGPVCALARSNKINVIAKNSYFGKYQVVEHKEKADRGMEAVLEPGDIRVLIGNKKLLNDNKVSSFDYNLEANQANDRGEEALFVVVNKKLVGLICVGNENNLSVVGTIRWLKKDGVTCYYFASDVEAIAQSRAEIFHIEKVKAVLDPRQKCDKIEELEFRGAVMTVANGIDNMGMLSASSIGVTVGKNVEQIVEASDAIIDTEDMTRIYSLYDCGRTYRRALRAGRILSLLIMLAAAVTATGILPSGFTISFTEVKLLMAWMACGLAGAGTTLLCAIPGHKTT